MYSYMIIFVSLNFNCTNKPMDKEADIISIFQTTLSIFWGQTSSKFISCVLSRLSRTSKIIQKKLYF